MAIRTFQQGDESAQAEIYNEAASGLPKFKPAAFDEVSRRTKAVDFDAGTRFYAVEQDRLVGYATFQPNGRVSYPWCRKGFEHRAAPLFEQILQAMRARGLRLAFAAYRGDWPVQREFFLAQGFRLAREMVNFVVDLADLPTPAAASAHPVSPLTPADMPEVLALAPTALHLCTPEELERHLLHNPWFGPDSVFVLRSRAPGRAIVGIGILVEKTGYANPRQVDSAMPCFRLGAFGTEGMTVKRINGLFSFLAAPGSGVTTVGLDLLGQTVERLGPANLDTLAAQVPSDVPHLLRFYNQFFQKQGTFPVFELPLPA